jgi:ABC-type nitrate/sulfonate/bicarbonate transport system ATPase subunit
MPSLRASGISKSFGKGKFRRAVLENVELAVNEGEVAVVLGPSGCGKTTLLRIISGLLRPDSTDCVLKIGEENIGKPNGRISFVFQRYALFPWLTVEANVCFGMRLLGYRDDEISARSETLLTTIDLLAHRQDYPSTLSGGQAQRVALARCLATDPQVLLLDEPFSALDVSNRYRLRGEFLRVARKSQIASVFVTHDIREALLLADHITVLSRAPASVKCSLGSRDLGPLRALVEQAREQDKPEDRLEEVLLNERFVALYRQLREALRD